MAQNRIIGRNGVLPWHIPADLKRYKARTLGKPLVMGRKTLESLYREVGGPLPGRTNIVVTRQNDFEVKDGVVLQSSLEAGLDYACKLAVENGLDEVFINGGAQIYKQTLEENLASELDITLIHRDVEGDTPFPDFDWNNWREIWREDHPATEKNPAFSFVRFERVSGLK